MKIHPDYEFTPELMGLIKRIEALRVYFRSLRLPPEIKAKIERSNMLKSAIFSARLSRNSGRNSDFLERHPFLPPRQEEILNIIKDHIVVSFDMIRRRFIQVPERTLRYDLKKLLDRKLVEKSGETRGRYYRVRK